MPKKRGGSGGASPYKPTIARKGKYDGIGASPTKVTVTRYKKPSPTAGVVRGRRKK